MIVTSLSACEREASEPIAAAALPASFADGTDNADASATDTAEQGAEQGADQVADLSEDMLTPPPAPDLSITAAPGELKLQWSAVADTTSIALFVDDALPNGETRLNLDLSPDATSVTLPVVPHRVPWQKRRYRVELCTQDDCVSSRHASVADLANSTFQILTPAVQFDGERFGQPIAMSDGAGLAAIGSPLAGTIGVYFRFDDSWVLATELSLSDGTPDSTREFAIDVSATGDTIATLTKDQSTRNGIQLSIHDRLGEGWVETTRAGLDTLLPADDVSEGVNNTDVEQSVRDTNHPPGPAQLQLSADGNHLLIGRRNDTPVLLHRLDTGWQPAAAFTVPSGFKLSGSVAASEDLQTVFAIAERLAEQSAESPALQNANQTDESPAGSSVDATNGAPDNADADSTGNLVVLAWHESANTTTLVGQTTVPGLLTASNASLISDATGTRYVVATTEAAGSMQTPVLWGFEASNPARALGWQAFGSYRLAPLADEGMALQLTGNHDLSLLALSASTTDASELYTIDTGTAATWSRLLQLPEDASELARLPFATSIAMNRTGDTLLIAGQDRQMRSRVLVLR